MDKITIAIDGPAGAGKSTLARAVAEKLKITYLDTGAMYRACAWYALYKGIKPNNLNAVEAILPELNLQISFADGHQKIAVNGIDVTAKIRTGEVSRVASDISALPPVRVAMVDKQREIAALQPCVLDGRDIGTYVLPQAEIKIFLTAGIDARAERRWKEQTAQGKKVPLAEVKSDISYRDRQDSERDFAPLKQAADAIPLDNTEMSINECVDFVLKLVKEYERSKKR